MSQPAPNINGATAYVTITDHERVQTLPASLPTKIASLALRHLTVDDDVLETDPIAVTTHDVPFGRAMLLDTAAFGNVSIGIHPTFDSTDLSQLSPHMDVSLRRHGFRDHGLDYLRRFWERVADYMAADCAALLARSIERAIDDLGSRDE